MDDKERDQQAARILQKHWRQRRGQNTDGRWQDAMLEAQAATNLRSAERGENDPKSRMRRAVFLAGRLQEGEALPSDEDNIPETSKDNSKILETQHWLELTDGKHRYGSNCKFYHRKWQEEDTEENFFKWLDRGGGKDLSLPECSREQLEKQRIIYLSKEQRANYLVKIDEKGLLRWARNDEYVDTRSNRWKDAGDGQGIIAMTLEEMRGAELSKSPSPHGRMGFLTSSSESLNPGEEHYTESAAKPGDNKVMRALRNRFSSQGVMERLLRKTVKKNTWIYRNLFIGIKETGAFQHSSFTAGGLISSAGLITVKSGRIHKLSPLSGHYRTSVQHFRLFLDDLAERGADLSKVQVTKAELTLWGLEHYKRFQKAKQAKQKELTDKAKNAVSSKPNAKRTESSASHIQNNGDSYSGAFKKKLDREKEKDAEWNSGKRWRRDILCGRSKHNPASPVPNGQPNAIGHTKNEPLEGTEQGDRDN
ncbi:hypothetical protein RhiJN_28365 [Ceratobasidium sp. AG-Ba]|nr:hypothetical protein RhiJN_28365 [Ceratobasidium sp. AG-Ba]